MEKQPDQGRTDCASRIVKASPQTVYRALLDPRAVAVWLPPAGMRAQIHRFDPREGGAYCVALIHDAPDHRTPGKTSEHADLVEGSFVELIPPTSVSCSR